MGAQTSNKSGVKSTTKKMEYSRHGFDPQPAAKKVPGAFGKEDEDPAPPDGDKHSALKIERDKGE